VKKEDRSMNTESQIRRLFDENGYVIIKKAFTEQEIDKFRVAILESLALRRTRGEGFKANKTVAGDEYFHLPDLMSIEELADLDNVVLHPTITNLVQQLLAGPVCYFGDSTAQIGTGDRGFHKDNVNRSDPKGPDWQSNYDVLRLAIYTQDTYSYSGGMQVRVGSHLSAKRFFGKPKNIRMKKGDVLVWKLTMSHSGNTLLPRIFPNFSWILPRVTNYLPSWLFRPYEKERVALFMSFGVLESTHTKNYLRYLENRTDNFAFYPKELQNQLSLKRNITLVPLEK
jgi:hypothetical protein